MVSPDRISNVREGCEDRSRADLDVGTSRIGRRRFTNETRMGPNGHRAITHELERTLDHVKSGWWGRPLVVRHWGQLLGEVGNHGESLEPWSRVFQRVDDCPALVLQTFLDLAPSGVGFAIRPPPFECDSLHRGERGTVSSIPLGRKRSTTDSPRAPAPSTLLRRILRAKGPCCVRQRKSIGAEDLQQVCGSIGVGITPRSSEAVRPPQPPAPRRGRDPTGLATVHQRL